jgi:hypothetical protein
MNIADTPSIITQFIPDLFGILGLILIQGYYFLLLANKCKANDLSFLLANTLGSMCILVSLWFDWNLYAFIIEISWMLTSLYGCWRRVHKTNI